MDLEELAQEDMEEEEKAVTEDAAEMPIIIQREAFRPFLWNRGQGKQNALLKSELEKEGNEC